MNGESTPTENLFNSIKDHNNLLFLTGLIHGLGADDYDFEGHKYASLATRCSTFNNLLAENISGL